MRKIAFFITGHGFGHGVRTSTVINALSEDFEVTVFTTLPEGFLREELRRPFRHRALELDCGCVQPDTVQVDIEATFRRYAGIDARREVLIGEVSALLARERFDLVYADIPPLAFPIAKAAGIPSLGVGNFSWTAIYREYLECYPAFGPLLRRMEEDYAEATEMLLLEPGLPGGFGREPVPIGLLARPAPLSAAAAKEKLAARFGLDGKKPWCLVYIGSYGLPGIRWERLERFAGWQFLGLYALSGAPPNYRVIAKDASFSYAELTSSCEVVLGKLGYGLVAECLHLGKPVLFLQRRDFAEYALLKDLLLSRRQGREIGPEDLRDLRLSPHLEELGAEAYVPEPAPALERIIARVRVLAGRAAS